MDKQDRATRAAAAPPGELGWRLGMVLRGYQERLEKSVAGMPEQIRGFQVLSTVVHRDPPNQAALGAHLGIDKTVLTYLLDSLVDAGLVQRVPAPADRRARRIIATARGVAELERCERQVAVVEDELLSALTAKQATALTEYLGELAMHVHRANPGTNPCEAIDHLP